MVSVCMTGTPTLSVTSRSRPWVNTRDASSRWSTIPQFFDRASARESAYSCTFGERCARRLSNAAIVLRALGKRVSTRGEEDRIGGCKPCFAFILHFVAEVEDGFPILAGEVFVGCFRYMRSWRDQEDGERDTY